MKRLRVLLGVVAVAFGALVVAPAGPAFAAGGVFHTVCGYTHSSMDDPIVFPRQPGVAHMHDFGGNVSTNAYSTLLSLRAHTTNCFVHAPDLRADRSGYWVPRLLFNGKSVHFSQQQTYYQSKIGPVRTPPPGIELIGGNSKATAPQSTNVVKFTCAGSAGALIGARNKPPVCPSGSYLKIVVMTPNCLAHSLIVNGADGRNDTSLSRYAPAGGKCPAGFDPIVQARIEVKYPPGIDGRGKIAFSSGPYWTMHADWFNAWAPKTLDRFVKYCINVGRDCGNTMP